MVAGMRPLFFSGIDAKSMLSLVLMLTVVYRKEEM